MEVKNNNKKKKQKETAAFVRTLLTKPISPPSYFTLLSQQLSLLLPEKKPVQLFDISSGFHRNSYSFQTKLFSTVFSENVSCLYVTAALAIDTDTSAGGKDLIYIGYYYPVVVPAY